MKKLYDSGQSFQKIATTYNVSRERVRQIFARYFQKTAKDNAVRINISILKDYQNKKDKLGVSSETEECRYSRWLKCSKDVYVSIMGHPYSFASNATTKSPAARYIQQMRFAGLRGIGWEITFPEWWDIWQKSGKYHLRGRGHGYCMSRVGDTGTYSKDNVTIKTSVENIKEYYECTSKEEVSKRIKDGRERNRQNGKAVAS